MTSALAANNWSGTRASYVFALLVSCLTAVCKRKCIHSNVFNSFHLTVTHVVTHRIIYKEILSMRWSPHFSAFEPTSQQKFPQTGTCHFTILPPSSKTSPEDTRTQSLITNFLSINPPHYESNHHKQDLLITTSKIFHCLLQFQIIKS